jgi:2,3-bisphosphoglycerate-independent phosphoglycerate mutase
MQKKVILCILDGWGVAPASDSNGVSVAKNWPNILKKYPNSTLEASESFVGLPDAQMGNSEVGHMAIGLGRVLLQDLPKIDSAFASGYVNSNPQVLEAITYLKANQKPCHVMGLLSPGGVHSHMNHIKQAAILLATQGIPVFVHAFLDGRDTPPKSALNYMDEFIAAISAFPLIKIASVSGRYYSMDRDNRYERTEKAYKAIISGDGIKFSDPLLAINNSYNQGITDEFMLPHVNDEFKGAQSGDGLWMINFRSDRVRQLLKSLLFAEFSEFKREKITSFGHRLAMNEYADFLNPLISSIFMKDTISDGLGEILANNNLKQLRVAETEKYAHVTFFFNGGIEQPLNGEERILIPSPKVSTYDLQPEMSAYLITEKVLSAMDRNDLSLIVVNFANADMVGHTGVVEAIKKAVTCLDDCVQKIVDKSLLTDWTMLITADHGNAESMQEDDNTPHTAHTCNPVPLVMINGDEGVRLANGTLADISPTILSILNINQPASMTGKILLC